jgi:hypothetical protein
MLARPEIGSKEHILLWLENKPPDEKYDWENYAECACGQYSRESLGKSNLWWIAYMANPGCPMNDLNRVAFFYDTFGELLKAVRMQWGR